MLSRSLRKPELLVLFFSATSAKNFKNLLITSKTSISVFVTDVHVAKWERIDSIKWLRKEVYHLVVFDK